jgi:hypothetical protein
MRDVLFFTLGFLSAPIAFVVLSEVLVWRMRRKKK